MTQKTVDLLNQFYTGICSACFEPIRRDEQPFMFRENGRKFHLCCTLRRKNNYYVRLERKLALKETKR